MPNTGGTPTEGTGTGTGTGGSTVPPGQGTSTSVDQVGEGSKLGFGTGGGYYKSPTGYWVPSYVKTTGGAKWQNPNMNPTTWKGVQMTGTAYKGLWKVVDDKDVIIAAEFKSKEETDEFISEHVAAYHGGTNPGGTGTGGSTPTTGGGTGTGTGTGTGGQMPNTGGTPTGTGTPTTTTQPGGGQQNFQYQNNGKSYQYQNGVVTTNMTEAEILAAEQARGSPFPGHGAAGGTGTGTGGGTPTGAGVLGPVQSPYDMGMNVVQITDNDKHLFWKKQNGVITTNMSAAQLRQYGLEAPSGTPTSGGGGGMPGTGGTPTGSGGGGVSVSGGNVTAGNASIINGTVTAGNVVIKPDGTIIIGGKNVIGGGSSGGGSGGGGMPGTVNLGSGMLMRTSDAFGDNRNYAQEWDTTGVLWAKGGIKTQQYPPSSAGDMTGTGGTGSGTSTSTQTRTNTGGNYQYTDANGNNYNSQNDVNNQSNTQGVLTPTGGMTTATAAAPMTGTGTSGGTPTGTTTGNSFSGVNSNGSIVRQSQSVSQSGTGQQWYYQNQDGRVNTNMTPEMLALFGLGGGLPTGSSSTGGGSFGNRAEPGQLDVRTGIDNTVPIYDVGPTKEGRDFATQRFASGTGFGGAGPGGLPGFPFGDIGKWIMELMNGIMRQVRDGLKGIHMNIDLDGHSIMKSYSADIMRNYNSQF